MREPGRCHLGTDLDLLIDDCLAPVRRDGALAHVAGCDVCRRELDAARRVRGRLRALADAPPVPPALTARLLAIGAEAFALPHPPALSRQPAVAAPPAQVDRTAGGHPPAGGYLPVWRPATAASPSRGARERAVLLAGGALSVAGLALAGTATSTTVERPGARTTTTITTPGSRPGGPVTPVSLRVRPVNRGRAALLSALPSTQVVITSFQPADLLAIPAPVSRSGSAPLVRAASHRGTR